MRPPLPSRLDSSGTVVVVRHVRPPLIPALADCLVREGLGALEVTLNSEGALAAIGDLRERYTPDELDIGAGTVLDLRAAQRAVDHGARFLVTPHTDSELISWAAQHDLPCLAGAFTPTEVLIAWRAGAAAVKLFPAELVGPRGLCMLRGPLDQVPMIPTGGVTADNAAEYLAAGARAVAVGSWLIGDGDLDAVAMRASALRAKIAAAMTGVR